MYSTDFLGLECMQRFSTNTKVEKLPFAKQNVEFVRFAKTNNMNTVADIIHVYELNPHFDNLQLSTPEFTSYCAVVIRYCILKGLANVYSETGKIKAICHDIVAAVDLNSSKIEELIALAHKVECERYKVAKRFELEKKKLEEERVMLIKSQKSLETQKEKRAALEKEIRALRNGNREMRATRTLLTESSSKTLEAENRLLKEKNEQLKAEKEKLEENITIYFNENILAKDNREMKKNIDALLAQIEELKSRIERQ